MENSPARQEGDYEIGGNYQAIAVYDQAAEWSRTTRADPNGENADKALADASSSASASARRTKAIADAQTFNKNYGAEAGADGADRVRGRRALRGPGAVGQGEGRAHRLRCRPSTGPRRTSRSRRTRRSLAPTKLKADPSRRGVRQGPRTSGRTRATRRPRSAARTHRGRGPEDKRLAKTLNAVGEAFFYAAERAQGGRRALKFPGLLGPGRQGLRHEAHRPPR